MAPRPYWKGYLKLSLVSCPIALTPATSSSEKVSFRQVNKETGKSEYNILSERGTIQRIPADGRKREAICTGLRFTVSLAFNAAQLEGAK